jgi:hypothetical protein
MPGCKGEECSVTEFSFRWDEARGISVRSNEPQQLVGGEKVTDLAVSSIDVADALISKIEREKDITLPRRLKRAPPPPKAQNWQHNFIYIDAACGPEDDCFCDLPKIKPTGEGRAPFNMEIAVENVAVPWNGKEVLCKVTFRAVVTPTTYKGGKCYGFSPVLPSSRGEHAGPGRQSS